MAGAKKPNILVIMSDDIGTWTSAPITVGWWGADPRAEGRILDPTEKRRRQRPSLHHGRSGTNGHTAVSCERSGNQFQRGMTQ
jgi:hypothetical protein